MESVATTVTARRSMYLTSAHGATNRITSYVTYIKLKKKNITLEIKIVLEAYITMDFDVLGCNYEIFSFCQTAIGEKLMKNSKEQQLFINLKKRL